MKGTLTLIPTPIDDESPLCIKAKELLLDAFAKKEKILVEELKAGRRRWLHFGLPREAIEHFVLYNEHTRDQLNREIIADLKRGVNVFLMSDCGLPAFCDPGQELVNLCHISGLRVTSSPFANSIALAVSLSGFAHNRFIFEGFIPAKKEMRSKEIKRIIKQREMSIIMDTPYRLKKLLEELQLHGCGRDIFLGLDLNQKSEELLRGNISELLQKINEFKREFILILGPK